MHKKYLSLLIATLIVLPTNVWASELPRFKNPTLPPLETPQLSKTYEEMRAELERQGLGRYRFDPNKPLPLLDVEAPEGTGKDVMEKFYSRFGDMWNDPSRQLDTESRMPSDSFFTNHTLGFERIFEEAKKRDNATLEKELAETLDMGILWDLDKIKEGMTKFSERERQNYLEGTPKPPNYEEYRRLIDSRLNQEATPPTVPGLMRETPEGAPPEAAQELTQENVMDRIGGWGHAILGGLGSLIGREENVNIELS